MDKETHRQRERERERDRNRERERLRERERESPTPFVKSLLDASMQNEVWNRADVVILLAEGLFVVMISDVSHFNLSFTARGKGPYY